MEHHENEHHDHTEHEHTEQHDSGSNASGSQSGGSAVTYDVVDSGQSDDIENSLTGQGVSDRETTVEVDRDEATERDGE